MSREVLSAAVDAAATDAEWDALIDALDRDPALMAEWSRLWAARDARDGVKLAAGRDFCGGVMSAIASEAPLPSHVVAFPSRTAAAVRRRQAWKTLVPLSAAAGVVAAVLAVGGLRSGQSLQPENVVAAEGAAAEALPVRNVTLAEDDRAAILNAYLMEHSNTLADRSMGGALANARFAAHTASYRPDSP
jgi:negative regulator of sigma E activity